MVPSMAIAPSRPLHDHRSAGQRLDLGPRHRRCGADRRLLRGGRKRRGPGFLRDGRGYRDIDFPGVDVTVAMGNSVTRIVGGYIDLDGISHGYVLKKGGYQSIDVPGAEHTRA